MSRKRPLASILLITFTLSGCGAGTTKSDWTYSVNMPNSNFDLQNLAMAENPSDFRFFRHTSQNYAADSFQADGVALNTVSINDYSLRTTIQDVAQLSAYSLSE